MGYFIKAFKIFQSLTNYTSRPAQDPPLQGTRYFLCLQGSFVGLHGFFVGLPIIHWFLDSNFFVGLQGFFLERPAGLQLKAGVRLYYLGRSTRWHSRIGDH